MSKRAWIVGLCLVSLGALGARGLEMTAETKELSEDAQDPAASVRKLGADAASALANAFWDEELSTSTDALELPKQAGAPPTSVRDMGTLPAMTASKTETKPDGDAKSARTAPIAVTHHWPKGQDEEQRRRRFGRPRPRYPLEPVLLLGFSRPADIDAIAGAAYLEGPDGRLRVERADIDDVRPDSQLEELAEELGPERRLIFRPASKLEPATSYTFGLDGTALDAAGQGHVEGGRSYTFDTVEPFALGTVFCSEDRPCEPRRGMTVRFNNLIDPESFDLSKIELPSSLEGAEVIVQGSRDSSSRGALRIRAYTEPGQTYEVQIDESLTDIHGQTLGKPEVARFHIGHRKPAILNRLEEMTVLQPSETLKLRTTNIETFRVEVARVDVAALSQYKGWIKKYPPYGNPQPPFVRTRSTRELVGKNVVVDREVRVEGRLNEIVTTVLDPSEWKAIAGSHFVVRVRPTEFPEELKSRRNRRVGGFMSWVQVTDLGIDRLRGGESDKFWVTRLSTAEPVEGATVTVLPDGRVGKTNDKGLTTIPHREGDKFVRDELARVELDDEVAWLPLSQIAAGKRIKHSGGNSGGRARTVFHIATDRSVYAAGDRVHVAGWVRAVDPGANPRVAPPPGDRGFSYRLVRNRETVVEGKGELTSEAGFGIHFDLPSDIEPGSAWLYIETENGDRTRHNLLVGRPRGEFMSMNLKGPDEPVFVDESPVFSVDIRQMAGSKLQKASGRWRALAIPMTYKPPGWHEFRFGDFFKTVPDEELRTFTSTELSPPIAGRHEVELRFNSLWPRVPVSLWMGPRVDADSVGAGSVEIERVVYPSRVQVGLKVEKRRIPEGSPIRVDVIAVDPDGNAVDGRRIDVLAQRMEWMLSDEGWRRIAVSDETCRLDSSFASQACEFSGDHGGVYMISAWVTDEDGRDSMSRVSVAVQGAPDEYLGPMPAEMPELQVTSDKPVYEPGDTAKIGISSPFPSGRGVISYLRSGVPETQIFDLKARNTTIELDIPEGLAPRTGIKVQVVSDKLASTDTWPGMAYGHAYVDIGRPDDQLDVSIDPSNSVSGDSGSISLATRVTDHQGEPVEGAEVALFVVEEKALLLGDHAFEDPAASFATKRVTRVGGPHLRQFRPPVSASGVDEPSGAADTRTTFRFSRYDSFPRSQRGCCSALPSRLGREQPDPVDIPDDWTPMSRGFFGLKTGPHGSLKVDLELGEGTSDYRVFAMASRGGQAFGHVEDTLSAADYAPRASMLEARVTVPDVIKVGDAAELEVLLVNHGEDAARVELGMRATGLGRTEPDAREVSIPGGGRARVSFRLAPDAAGPGAYQVAWRFDGKVERRSGEIDVEPESAEPVVRYGVTDSKPSQYTLEVPEAPEPRYGGIEISLGQSPSFELQDVLMRDAWAPARAQESSETGAVSRSPYDQYEALWPGVFFDATLLDVRGAMPRGTVASKEALRESLLLELEKMSRSLAYGRRDGGVIDGFSLRDAGMSYEAMSLGLLHAGASRFELGMAALRRARALVLAHDTGVNVPDSLEGSFGRLLQQAGWEARRITDARQQAKLYAHLHYLKSLSGMLQLQYALHFAKLEPERELPPDAVALLVLALHDQPEASSAVQRLVDYLAGNIVDRGEFARFEPVGPWDELDPLHRDVRTQALVLHALSVTRPNADIVDKLAAGLLDARTNGGWGAAVETAWAVSALRQYADASAVDAEPARMRVWIGETLLGTFDVGADGENQPVITLPMSQVLEIAGDAREVPITLEKLSGGAVRHRIEARIASAGH